MKRMRRRPGFEGFLLEVRLHRPAHVGIESVSAQEDGPTGLQMPGGPSPLPFAVSFPMGRRLPPEGVVDAHDPLQEQQPEDGGQDDRQEGRGVTSHGSVGFHGA